MKQATHNIGIKTETLPASPCQDKHCPFHGRISLRGRIFTANVLSVKAAKTATVGWERRYHIRKFERYGIRMTKLQVHNPVCIHAEKGDTVKIAETRPLSKTKHFVIIEKVKASHVRFVEHEFAGKKRTEAEAAAGKEEKKGKKAKAGKEAVASEE
ncbi:30S ribosomal protein S17 [Candidatus Woesearchaeota archaeon]|nr:30S ribosomal protein S17 [Candidatus Woesearchaeota archaeon]